MTREMQNAAMRILAVETRKVSFDSKHVGADQWKALSSPEVSLAVNGEIDHPSRRLLARGTLKLSGSPSSESPVALEIVMEAFFEWSEPLPLTPEAFLQNNVAVILWPFFRKHVLDLTTAAGLPPLVLPLVNFAAAQSNELTATPPTTPNQ